MKRVIKNCLLVLGMGFAAAALISRWPEIQPRLAGTNCWLLAMAGAGLLIYQFINAGVWSLVLGSLGQRVPFAKSARVWLQSEALRWLPGGIWGYGSRVVNARELGVEKGRASTSLVLELALTNLAWGLTACLLFFTPLAGKAFAFLGHLITKHSSWIMVSASAAGMAALALFLALFLCKTARGRVLRDKLKGLLPWGELDLATTFQTTLAYLGLCFYNGLLLALVILAVPNLSLSPFVVIGIGGAAWLAGFWAIGVPGGIGVREAALAGMLAVFGDLDSGIAVAILWRGIQVVVELISLGLVSLPVFRMGHGAEQEKTTVALRQDEESGAEAVPQARPFRRFRLLNLL